MKLKAELTHEDVIAALTAYIIENGGDAKNAEGFKFMVKIGDDEMALPDIFSTIEVTM